jgi:tetratricopeptide (TPR) repeat protein
MDLSNIPNPYDFANPVTLQNRFFGRTSEMSEIRYYLDHAKTADRPINVALLGDRAAGKTSILNMTALEARMREFCTVRIDLDEDDAVMQMMFFYKVFDGLVTAACELGAFGGLQGKTYETYLNVITSCLIPEDKLFCPFLFPLQYGLATKSGNLSAPVSDQQIKHDLLTISKEMKRPIVVLFDESNVLAKSRVLLEKLRNIFMNIPGYMLVLTGTLDLFPIIDDVFSPIVRQFKKITVKEFSEKKDTAECVRGPLRIGGLSISVSDSEIDEIHDLSGGKPYEIQLICHLLFRRIQGGRAAGMHLDLGVLEELRHELERSQDITTRPTIGAIKNLTTKQLRALRALTMCDGQATLAQLWDLHYVFEGTGEFTKNQLMAEFSFLRDEGVIGEKNNKVSFNGDYFDKLYAKYFAAQQRVQFNIRPLTFESALMMGVLKFVRPIADYSVFLGADSWTTIENVARTLGDRSSEEDVFRVSPNSIEDLYMGMVDRRKKDSVPALFVSLNVEGSGTTAVVLLAPGVEEAKLDTVKKNLQTVKSRVENLGGALLVERRDLSVAPMETLKKKVLRTQNQPLRKELARRHVDRLFDEYRNDRREEAKVHGYCAYEYDPMPDEPKQAVHLGYFFMTENDLSKAEGLFRRALELTEGQRVELRAYALYDLSIVLMKTGKFDEAAQLLISCSKLLEERDIETDPACLYVPQMEGKCLSFTEAWEPDFRAVCNDAIKLLRNHISSLTIGSSPTSN